MDKPEITKGNLQNYFLKMFETLSQSLDVIEIEYCNKTFQIPLEKTNQLLAVLYNMRDTLSDFNAGLEENLQVLKEPLSTKEVQKKEESSKFANHSKAEIEEVKFLINLVEKKISKA